MDESEKFIGVTTEMVELARKQELPKSPAPPQRGKPGKIMLKFTKPMDPKEIAEKLPFLRKMFEKNLTKLTPDQLDKMMKQIEQGMIQGTTVEIDPKEL